jgi:hypothetical protein
MLPNFPPYNVRITRHYILAMIDQLLNWLASPCIGVDRVKGYSGSSGPNCSSRRVLSCLIALDPSLACFVFDSHRRQAFFFLETKGKKNTKAKENYKRVENRAKR